VGYRFAIRSVEHGELGDGAEVWWSYGAVNGAIGEIVFKFIREGQLVGEIVVASAGFL
jgi:hypothetical protein